MMYQEAEEAELVVLSAVLEDARHYGRIIRNAEGGFEKITEFKDCNEEEKKVREINSGIYAFNNEMLFEYLPLLKNDNAQKEYYITDLVQIFKDHGKRVKAVPIEDPAEASGINDRVELHEAQKWLMNRINTAWMRAGVTIIDPESTYISPLAEIGKDTIIYPNTFIYGHSIIGENNLLKGANEITNTVIGNNNVICSSILENCTVKDNQTIAPFTYLRKKTVG